MNSCSVWICLHAIVLKSLLQMYSAFNQRFNPQLDLCLHLFSRAGGLNSFRFVDVGVKGSDVSALFDACATFCLSCFRLF